MGSPAFEPQRVLSGRYRLEQRLGSGGMGAIWRAQHLTLEAPVAVKLIEHDAVPDEQTVSRFLREAKAAAALRSRHVVQILDYGVEDGVPFIVMELLEGENLAQRIKRLGRLSPGETVRIVTHVARAIGRAHDAGIVHRDLKPENVFLVPSDEGVDAKVLDFGVAKVEKGVLRGDGTETRTGSILGTPYYMSPEQAQGNKTVDFRTDLWALAVIVFECLTGTRPFYSDGLGDLVLQICVRDVPVPSQVAEVPPGFDAWFARATQREPEQRFQSARELAETLAEALNVEMRGSAPESQLPAFTSPEPPHSLNQTSARRRRPEPSTPDPTAPTMEVEKLHVQTELEVTARPYESLQAPGSGLGMVVAVAAVALGLGLGGGIWLIQKMGKGASPWSSAAPAASTQHAVRRSESPPTPVAPPAVTIQTAPSDEPLVPEGSARGQAPSANTGQPPSSPSGGGAPVRPTPASRNNAEPRGPADAGVAPPDAWVKPAWAIPDEEPRRVDPIDENPAKDEKNKPSEPPH
ncbi:MAG TPA: protein kinase [Polyangiaceae bacterium]|nr:protein kinase [Polyangiaceae bacterium]